MNAHWNKAPPHTQNREKNETKWPRLSSCSHRHPRHHFLKEGSSPTTQTTVVYKEGEESSLLLEYLKVKCEKAQMTNLLVIHTFLPAWPILFVMTYMVNEQKHVHFFVYLKTKEKGFCHVVVLIFSHCNVKMTCRFINNQWVQSIYRGKWFLRYDWNLHFCTTN